MRFYCVNKHKVWMVQDNEETCLFEGLIWEINLFCYRHLTFHGLVSLFSDSFSFRLGFHMSRMFSGDRWEYGFMECLS